MPNVLSRRRFLGSAALAGIAASMLPAPGAPAAEPGDDHHQTPEVSRNLHHAADDP
jgi:hypothetical protein